MFTTKKQAASSCFSTASPPTTAGIEIFSPASSFGRLHRLLSSKKKKKSSLLVIPATPDGSLLERVFRRFDKDGDGKISQSELKSCIQTVGQELSLEDATAVVKEVGMEDSVGDGLLGMEDFVKMVEVEEEVEEKRCLRETFEMYEIEGSGCITPKSLKRMLGRLRETRTIEQCRPVWFYRCELQPSALPTASVNQFPAQRPIK